MKIVLPMLALCACASVPVPAAPLVADPAPPPQSGHGSRVRSFDLPKRLIDAKNGAVLDPETMFGDLLSARAIYVSEQHSNPHHHAAQLAIIAGVWARDPSVAIGLEMIKRPFQPALDDYLAGTIDARELQERVEWEDRWGYSFELYRGIFEFAKAHKIPLYALNVQDEITAAVASGGVEALTPEQKESLPDLDLGNEAHRAQIQEAFGAHHAHAAIGSFENFYAAQVIWDETMAYEIARVLGASDAPKHMIVLAGDGHIHHGHGIPSRAARRGITPHRIIIPIMLRELNAALADRGGDYFWVMAASEEDFSGATTHFLLRNNFRWFGKNQRAWLRSRCPTIL